MKTCVVTGATGFVGRKLCRALHERGDEVRVLSRSPGSARAAVPFAARHARWDPELELAPPDVLRDADLIIHLAGEPVAAGRWTAERKRRIYDSRILGTRNLVGSLIQAPARPGRVLVSASAVGYYGDRGGEQLTEESSRGQGFLSIVTEDWEKEALDPRLSASGTRVILPRIGVVLGKGGGALAKMLPVFRLGAGGRLGSGRQWMSWIHVDDLVSLLLWAAGEVAAQGPLNAIAPEPVTNVEFTRTLARALRRPALVSVPALALRAAFGEMAGVLLSSQKVSSGKATGLGFRFRHPRLGPALAELI